MDHQNFLITEDKATADALFEAGLQIVQVVGGSWLFLNDKSKMLFACSKADMPLRYTYTNRMMF